MVQFGKQATDSICALNAEAVRYGVGGNRIVMSWQISSYGMVMVISGLPEFSPRFIKQET